MEIDRTYNLDSNSRVRSVKPTAVIVHWTGGSRDVPGVVSTLKTRGLSYHYIIEPDGDVFELVSPDRAAYHAGAANEWSIGVALVGRHTADFTEAQKESLLTLLLDLTQQYQIAVPTQWGVHKTYTVTRAKPLSGIYGHYQVNVHKIDPGPELLNDIATVWPDYEKEPNPAELPFDTVAEVIYALRNCISMLERLQDDTKGEP